jgi:hypothetical protein
MEPFMIPKIRFTGAVLAGLLAGASAHAVSFNFQDISGASNANNTADQIQVDVVAGAGSTVRFNFTFGAGDAGTITAIGFGGASTSLLTNTTNPTFFPGAGVSFENGSTPALGAGGFTQLFGVERTAQGGVSNGLSNGETLGIQYQLSGASTVAQVVAAINAGTFNIGLHIQSLDDGGSQKAVTGGGPPAVPDTGSTVAMLGLALIGLAGACRAFRR